MRPRLLLLAVLFVVFAIAGSQVRFTTDTQDILPADSDLRETLAAAQRFPGAQLLLVEIDGQGAPREDLERETLALAERLRALDAVASVRAGFSGEDGAEIAKRVAPYATAFVDAETVAENTQPNAVMEKLAAQKDRLSGFGGMFWVKAIQDDPLDLRQTALQQLQGSARPGIRPDGEILVDSTGQRALLLVSSAVEASAIGPHDARIAALDAAIAETPLPTRWFGGIRMAWETASAIERDVRVTAGLGMVLLAVVLFAGFRSWRPLVGAVLPSAVAAGAASMGAWFVSPVHGLQLGFSAALAGLAVDYWVHLYLAAATQPDQPDAAGRFRAATHALRDLMPALVVSAGSTALAFALLTTSALPIVRVLGVTGAAAAIGALLGTVVAGPVAWTLFGRPVDVPEPRLPVRFALPVAMGAVILGLLGATARFEPDPMALIATSPAAEAAQEAFADRYQLTTLRGIVLLDGETPGAALDRAARVQRAFGALEGVAPTGPGLLVPGPQTVAARRAALPDVDVLQARIDAATEAVGLPVLEGAAQRIHDWASQPPADLWDGTPMSARVTLLEDAGDLQGFTGAVAMISVPVPDEDRIPILEATLADADSDALLVVPGQLAAASMDAARTALVSRAALGGLAVFILLSIRHRSAFMAVVALAPAATAVTGALGLMALSGRPWNPVSLAAMVPVLGLAVDYGVFMTERATRTAPRAVILSAATTLAGFATLALAYSPALFGVGVATVAGVGMAALTALLVVPAVLDRRQIEPIAPGHYERRRWPGWEGWLLVVVALTAAGGSWLRGTDPVFALAILAVPATWLVLTALLRTPRRAPTPDLGLRILTVIPTKDNAGSIAEVVQGCLAHTEHVLVVDDGCTDGSGELADAAGAMVVRHPVNRGKGAALETALDWAADNGFSHIVAIDADGQHEPDDLPSFYDAVRAQPDAVVAGVRDMSEAPKGARYARANSNFWVWVESGQRMGDTQCGYRAYPVAPIRSLALVPSRYQWEVEVLVRSVWAGIPVIDHPCRVFYPPAEERVSSYRKVVDTARISWLNAHLIAERILWPPRWFPGRRSWQGSHRGFTAGWKLYLWVLKTLGPGPVRVALVPLVAFYWVFLGAQRPGIAHYLRRRFPEASGPKRAWLQLRLLLEFAWSLVDRFHVLLHGPDSEALQLELDRTEVPGLRDQLYGDGAFAGKGVMMISGHLGNADLGGMLLRGKDRKVNLLLYRAPGDPYFALMQDLLGPRAPAIIAINDGSQIASLSAIKALKNDEVVAAKGDRVVDGRTARCEFLGAPIDVPTGPFLLAALSGAPVVFIGCFRTGSGQYRFHAVGPRTLSFTSRKTREADLQRWAQEWVDVMAEWTATYPLQWFNFYDPWEGSSLTGRELLDGQENGAPEMRGGTSTFSGGT